MHSHRMDGPWVPVVLYGGAGWSFGAAFRPGTGGGGGGAGAVFGLWGDLVLLVSY
jgi:hypothetical protein